MYYLMSYDIEVKNSRKYLKANILNGETGELKTYSKIALNRLNKEHDILGYVRKSSYTREYIHRVDNEYLSLLKYVRSGAYKLALSGNLITAFCGDKISNFVDVTDLRNKFCLEHNINRLTNIYYPQGGANICIDGTNIIYSDNDSGDSFIIDSIDVGSKLYLVDKTYYNIDDNCLYFAIKMSRIETLLLIRMVDFKYEFARKL